MVTEQPYEPHRDGHDDDRSGTGAVGPGNQADARAADAKGQPAKSQPVAATDWWRLGRTRPVPFALFDEETGRRLSGRAERAEWNAVCDGGRPPAPEPVDPSVVPALPDEIMQALGWREVIAPRWDADEEQVRAFLGPAPTAQEAREIAECFGWDTGHTEQDEGNGEDSDGRATGGCAGDTGLGGADRLAHADPDPIPRGWPRPRNPALPVGLGPRTDGEVADVGAHARRQADWQALHDLERLDVPATDPYTLVEAMAAWGRQEALAGYHQRMLAFELAHRSQDLCGPPAFEAAAQATNPVAAAEVAFRLGVTRQRARRLIDAGTAMAQGSGLLVGIALQQGELDAAKADLIIERTAHLPMDLAMAVHDAVLPTAGLRTYPQIQRDLARAIAAIDPEDFSERHREARTARHVSAPRALPDGMAAMRLVTSAADAMALHHALEAAARAAKNSGDDRSLDQLRADALTTVGQAALASGHLGPCTPACAHPNPHPRGQGGNNTAQEQSETPARPAPEQGGRAVPDDKQVAGPGTAAPSTPAGDEADGTDTGAAFGLGTVGGAKAQIRITVPLSTLMGSSNEAGDLEGYGPIPAEVARANAAGGLWKRLVTDPLTNRVIEATARRYEPPSWLREQVIANEPYCTAPGCNTAARLADLDHGIPFPQGPTAQWNLHPLCRHHHRLKSEGHLGYTSPEPGVHEWTTPTGHRYRTDTGGTHLLPPEGQVGPVSSPASRAQRPVYPSEDDPPPF